MNLEHSALLKTKTCFFQYKDNSNGKTDKQVIKLFNKKLTTLFIINPFDLCRQEKNIRGGGGSKTVTKHTRSKLFQRVFSGIFKKVFVHHWIYNSLSIPFLPSVLLYIDLHFCRLVFVIGKRNKCDSLHTWSILLPAFTINVTQIAFSFWGRGGEGLGDFLRKL